MYFFKLGFLDGRYGFMIALFYAFQDYVSKVKFKEIYKVENRFSLRVSDYLMRKMVPVFMKNDKMSNDYNKGYNNCFNLVK
jgi:hypothetical protein